MNYPSTLVRTNLGTELGGRLWRPMRFWRGLLKRAKPDRRFSRPSELVPIRVDVEEIPGVRDRVDDFHRVDLASGSFDNLGADFDVLILGDVIEHLPDPLVTLKSAVRLLRPGGEIMLSVPNFGHWYPRLRVATGAFGYDRRGILGDTHLRFFTRRSLLRLARRAGLDVLEERHTGLPLGLVQEQAHGRQSVARRIDSALVTARPPLFAYQFVLRLSPHVESTHVSVFDGGLREDEPAST